MVSATEASAAIVNEAGGPADLDIALTRLCQFGARRVRRRIAESMSVAAAHGDLALGWMLAASGTCSLEQARTALDMGGGHTADKGPRSGATPN